MSSRSWFTARDETPAPNRFFRGLLLALALAISVWAGMYLTIFVSPWWIAMPIAAFGLLGGEFWWFERREYRDRQLAQVVGLDELGVVDTVDLDELDLSDWDDAQKVNRAWWCGLEDGTGAEEGERR